MPILPLTQSLVLAQCQTRPYDCRPTPWHLHARLALTEAANDSFPQHARSTAHQLFGSLSRPLGPRCGRWLRGGVLGLFFGGRMEVLKPVDVPEDYCEREALGFRKHTPLQPLIRTEWKGVERRACNRVIPHAAQCADQALGCISPVLGVGLDDHQNTGVAV